MDDYITHNEKSFDNNIWGIKHFGSEDLVHCLITLFQDNLDTVGSGTKLKNMWWLFF